MRHVRSALVMLCMGVAGCAGGSDPEPGPVGSVDSGVPPMSCECLATEFCNAASECESIFGRGYFVTVSALFGERNLQGECWDPDCSSPDPILVLSLDDEEVGRAGPIQDRVAETFPTFPVTFTQGRELSAEILDADPTSNEAILLCHVPLTPEQVQPGSSTCTWPGGSSITVSYARQ